MATTFEGAARAAADANVLVLAFPSATAASAAEHAVVSQLAGGCSLHLLQPGVASPASSIDFATSVLASHGEGLLADVARIARPGAPFVFREAVLKDGVDAVPDDVRARLSDAARRLPLRSQAGTLRALLFAGFVDGRALGAQPLASIGDDLRAVGMTEGDLGELGSLAHVVEFACAKPDYELGTSASLSLRSKKKKGAAGKGGWGAAAAAAGDDGAELVDENELVDEATIRAKPDPALQAECGPGSGRKRACKNCTCGLAEQEQEEKASAVKIGSDEAQDGVQPTSACGSCYLGDAFRCAGCPYRGLPPFKAGEKVKLAIGDDL